MLDLIHNQWHTEETVVSSNHRIEFDGFFGTYEVKLHGSNFEKTVTVSLNRNSNPNIKLELQ